MQCNAMVWYGMVCMYVYVYVYVWMHACMYVAISIYMYLYLSIYRSIYLHSLVKHVEPHIMMIYFDLLSPLFGTLFGVSFNPRAAPPRLLPLSALARKRQLSTAPWPRQISGHHGGGTHTLRIGAIEPSSRPGLPSLSFGGGGSHFFAFYDLIKPY